MWNLDRVQKTSENACWNASTCTAWDQSLDWTHDPNERLHAPKKNCFMQNYFLVGELQEHLARGTIVAWKTKSQMLVFLPKQCAQDCTDRRALTRQALVIFEEQRRAGLLTARERRKAAAAAVPAVHGQLPRPKCGRLCRSRSGLYIAMHLSWTMVEQYSFLCNLGVKLKMYLDSTRWTMYIYKYWV